MSSPKNLICLMFDKEAEQAVRFYAEIFPQSSVRAVHRASDDYPSGKSGDVLTEEFAVLGVSCVGVNAGEESVCGWCKDHWVISWQITPRALTETWLKEETKGSALLML